MMQRRFPPPWTVEEQDAYFVVRDHSGQALECPAGRSAFKTTRSYSYQNIVERSQFFHSCAVAKRHRKNKRPQLQARAKYCCRTEQEEKPHTPSSPKTA